MKLWTILLLALPAVAARADLAADAAAAEARGDAAAALNLYLAASAANPQDPALLEKVSEQYANLAELQPGRAACRSYGERAVDYASRAAALQPNAVNILAVAIAQGKVALYSDITTKVRLGKAIHEAAVRAIQLDPSYAWAHDILGQWECGVAGVSGTERFFVKVLFGGLPGATYADAIAQLRKATELEPGELTHWVELGLACQAAGDRAQARAALERGLGLPATRVYHASEQARARAALAQLN